MSNKYLEKIARMERDYDAHNALISNATTNKHGGSLKGWQGDLKQFNNVGSRNRTIKATKPAVKGIFSRVVSKII